MYINIYQQIYSPYGHRRPAENGLFSLLGFNGEQPDLLTGHYLLGQGRRAYNPVLMRFNSPNSLSPFGEGGFNPYTYCENDPINYADPSGKAKLFLFACRIFNQSNVSSALSSVKKSLGSVRKIKETKTPEKTKPPAPPNTQQINVLATKRSFAGGGTRKEPGTLTYKTMNANKDSAAQSRSALGPIHNFSGPGEWSVRLNPSQPAVRMPALRPIRNYALLGEWDILLVPDPMQPIITLIRAMV